MIKFLKKTQLTPFLSLFQAISVRKKNVEGVVGNASVKYTHKPKRKYWQAFFLSHCDRVYQKIFHIVIRTLFIKGVFTTLSNIYDGAFFPSELFDRVLNRPLFHKILRENLSNKTRTGSNPSTITQFMTAARLCITHLNLVNHNISSKP